MAHDPLGLSVSVVIPVRNGASTIAAQIHALFAQRGAPPFEVVVADNGSTDGTQQLVEVLTREAPPNVEVKIVSCPERVGVSAARNAGVAASRGELVLICDADDVVSPTWVERMTAALNEFDLVGGALDETTLNPLLGDEHRRGLGTSLPVSLRFLPYAVGANIGIHRRVIDSVGGWDERFLGGGDDIDFSWRAQIAGYTLGFCDDAVIHYRLRKDLKGNFLQGYRYNRAGPKLYREYRHLGVRRRPARWAAYSWYWILSRAPIAVFSGYGFRLQWCRRLGAALGYCAGSITNRVVFL